METLQKPNTKFIRYVQKLLRKTTEEVTVSLMLERVFTIKGKSNELQDPATSTPDDAF